MGRCGVDGGRGHIRGRDVRDVVRAFAPPGAHLLRVHPITASRTSSVAGRATRPARPAAALTVALALAVAVGACGDDPTGAGAGEDAHDVTGAPGRDPIGVPSGTDPAAVAPYVEDLLSSYNESVNQIAADPTLAAEPDGVAVVAYRDLFEPGSEVADVAVAFWRNQAVVGDSTLAYDPDHPAFATRVDGPVETVSAQEVTFPTCVHVNYETVNAAGARVGVEPGASEPGRGTAVLVEGGWRLRRLDRFTGGGTCRAQG